MTADPLARLIERVKAALWLAMGTIVESSVIGGIYAILVSGLVVLFNPTGWPGLLACFFVGCIVGHVLAFVAISLKITLRGRHSRDG